ncbi:MAG TPA: ATP-binding protein [Caulobacteraceae bacterium]|nr:ATP-binding protein [Caulobacteraceae bacterium]
MVYAAGRPVVAAADDFEFTLDRDWRITSITSAAAAWCGSTVENLLGRNGREVNPAATTMLGDAIDAALQRGVTTTREQPSTHVPGRRVRIQVSRVGAGARIRFEDITAPTDRKEADAVGRTLGSAEIVLLDQQGVITAANAAWRAAVVAQGLGLANAGVGARYAEVGKTLAKDIDEAALQQRLDELISGRLQQFEATYEIETKRGLELRQVRIAPLRVGDATYFAAIHEDLSERAKILATLHETSDQLLHAQEMERQRIAIELHDSMSQHLAGLVMGLAQLRLRVVEDQRSQALIDDMSKLTQLAIRETRVLSYLMNAAGDDEEGLEVSVRRFVEGFGRRTGLKASFRADGPVDAVSAVVRHTIFRVTQEALSNVYRHAKAAGVSVELASRAGAMTVRIADDGRGIERTSGVSIGQPPLGVGIPGMRARIEQLGGSLDIRGGAGGTVVTATIPLRSPRPALAAVAG